MPNGAVRNGIWWREAIRNRPEGVSRTTVQTLLGRYTTSSRPAEFRCTDGDDYVLKGPQVGHMVVTEHVAGLLGARMRAPVGNAFLVEVPADFLDYAVGLEDWVPGPAHASPLLTGVSDSLSVQYLRVGNNRSRFAHLAVFYGWFAAKDCQYLYQEDPPHAVLSVDHGDFLPGGPDWTLESLAQDRGGAEPFRDLVQDCRLTGEDLRPVLRSLALADDPSIAAAVASAPQAWNVTLREKVALAMYLARRRDEITAVVQQLA